MLRKCTLVLSSFSIFFFSLYHVPRAQTWTRLSPTESIPTTRYGHTAVYDYSNNLMILFGRFNGAASYLNDVWVLSNANGLGGTSAWTQLTTPGSAPTTRNYHTAVYDPINNRMTIFGGFNNAYLNDLWVLSSADVPVKDWNLYSSPFKLRKE